jgi:hypothetical protein
MDRESTNQKVEGDGKKAEPDGGDLGEIQRPGARGLRRIISVTTEKPTIFHQHPQPKAGRWLAVASRSHKVSAENGQPVTEEFIGF